MKQIALTLMSVIAALVFTSCCGSPFSLCDKNVDIKNCSSCVKKQTFPHQGCEGQRYIEKQVTEYVEEQIVVEGKDSKGGMTTNTITVKRPVVKTIREEVDCGDCGSKFCPTPDCCGIVPVSVLSRATAQGGTGEPHLGTIPTMKVLVGGATENSEL